MAKKRFVVTLNGVRVSDLFFYDYLLPEVTNRAKDYLRMCQSVDGKTPTRNEMETFIRESAEKLIGKHKGRPFQFSARSWKLWGKIILSHVERNL